eukprot:5662181-Amphidinium_carterae.1
MVRTDHNPFATLLANCLGCHRHLAAEQRGHESSLGVSAAVCSVMTQDMTDTHSHTIAQVQRQAQGSDINRS